MIVTIVRKELKSLFASPMGWLILAIIQGVLGAYFTLSFNQYFEILSLRESLPDRMGITQFICEGVFGVASIIFLFTIPLVSMRIISDEYRNQTMTLLTSAPISIKEIIMGKYIALNCYYTAIILVTLLMIATLSIWVELDYSLLLTNALGLWLLMSGIVALGLFFSSQTQYAVIAGFLTFLTTSFFLLIDKFYAGDDQVFFSYLSIMSHYRNFSHGLISTFDIAFFVLFATFFVLMAMHRLYSHQISS